MLGRRSQCAPLVQSPGRRKRPEQDPLGVSRGKYDRMQGDEGSDSGEGYDQPYFGWVGEHFTSAGTRHNDCGEDKDRGEGEAEKAMRRRA